MSHFAASHRSISSCALTPSVIMSPAGGKLPHAHTMHVQFVCLCSLSSPGIICHLINWWYKWDLITDLYPSLCLVPPLSLSLPGETLVLGAHAGCFARARGSLQSYKTLFWGTVVSVFSGETFKGAAEMKAFHLLISLSVFSFAPAVRLWVGALCGLRVEGVSETRGESVLLLACFLPVFFVFSFLFFKLDHIASLLVIICNWASCCHRGEQEEEV